MGNTGKTAIFGERPPAANEAYDRAGDVKNALHAERTASLRVMSRGCKIFLSRQQTTTLTSTETGPFDHALDRTEVCPAVRVLHCATSEQLSHDRRRATIR